MDYDTNKKKRNFADYVYILFFLFITAMLLYACFCCIKTIYNPAYAYEYILGIVISGCSILFLWIAGRNLNRCSRGKEIGIILFMIVFAFALRWMGICMMKTEQISDFATCNFAIEAFKNEIQDTSALEYCQDYYARYPAWFPYMRIVNLFYGLFCRGMIHAEAVKYANAVLNVITCAGIYYAARCYFKRTTAFVAGMLYACSPSMIIWTNIMSPDHITMCLFTLQAILWYWMWRKKEDRKACLILIILHSIVCVFINWFKPLSVLFFLVFMCFWIGTYQKQEKRKYSLIGVAYILSFFACFLIGSKTLTVWVEHYVQQNVIDSTWTYVYSGITMNNDGTLDSKRGNDKVVEVYEAYENLEEQQAVLKELTLEEIRKNGRKLPLLFLDKYKEAINSEGATWFWTNTNSQAGYAEKMDEVFGFKFYFTANGYYLLLLIFVLCNSIFQMLPRYKNVFVYSITLTIAGFICILVLSGVQSRYKLILAPYFMMLSACGLENFMDKLSQPLRITK